MDVMKDKEEGERGGSEQGDRTIKRKIKRQTGRKRE
jgi:hypothetical protein